MAKKKPINLNKLKFKPILDEAVAASRLGRTLASFGASLTGREKQDAKLIYALLNAKRRLPRSVTTARLSSEKKSKKTSPSDAIKWFAEKYPTEAQPLLDRLQQQRSETERSVLYGLKEGQDFPNSFYVDVLADVLEIPRGEAQTMYLEVILPHVARLEKDRGLVKLVVK